MKATTTYSSLAALQQDLFQPIQLQGCRQEEPRIDTRSGVKELRRLSVSSQKTPYSPRSLSVSQLRLAYFQPESPRTTTVSPFPFLTELFVSPHPDDICYSCYGKVHNGENKPSSSTSRMIVTIFSKSRCCNGHLGEELKQNLDNISQIRTNEDEAFAMSVGCQLIQLGLSDSSARDEFSRKEELAIQSKSEQAKAVKSHPTYQKVEKALNDLLRWAVKCKATIYMPVGIGCHIDHLMTRVATESILEQIRTESISRRLSVIVNYFEDLPYATYQKEDIIEQMTATVVMSRATEQRVELDEQIWSQKTKAVEGYLTQLKPTIIPSLMERASALAASALTFEQEGLQLRERIWTLAPGEWALGF